MSQREIYELDQTYVKGQKVMVKCLDEVWRDATITGHYRSQNGVGRMAHVIGVHPLVTGYRSARMIRPKTGRPAKIYKVGADGRISS